MMLTAVCPGSFDPITLGHLDIIERSTYIYDRIIVGIAENPSKVPLFSLEERSELVKEALKHLKKVEILPFDCLLVEFARQNSAKVIVKGLRAISDFEHEFQMAHLNEKLNSAIETIFMMASPECMFLSSSAVKEIASYGGAVSEFVPPAVEKHLKAKFFK
ncbi:MAG TPA: pantetheine-phosphate adenylyltransferase [Actinobacteria bacterium]|nr:pantetheine-phosphate adenylyltransferase [Actinomycetota bacterium]